jgi:hypothetical protein
VIIVPECDLESFPIAWMTARLLGAVLVYDAFYSRWDALVNDELEASKNSAKARLIRALETFTLRNADLVLADLDMEEAFRMRLHDPRIRRERLSEEEKGLKKYNPWTLILLWLWICCSPLLDPHLTDPCDFRRNGQGAAIAPMRKTTPVP